MDKENLLEPLKGKRVFITIRSQSSFTSSSIISILEDYDARFVRLLARRPVEGADQYTLKKEIEFRNLVQIDDIDSITDVSDDAVFEAVKASLKQQRAAELAAAAEAQSKPGAQRH